MSTPTVRRLDVDRELARALGARKLLPWSIATAIGGAVLGYVAGGGARAAAVLFALGLLFSAFAASSAIARCPACGARLPLPKKRPGPRGADPAEVERIRSCPRCRVRFE